jgi:ferredoxin
MIPVIGKNTCTGCGKCIDVCPPQAISLKDDAVCIESDLCEECGFCAAECPVDAISIPFPMSGK